MLRPLGRRLLTLIIIIIRLRLKVKHVAALAGRAALAQERVLELTLLAQGMGVLAFLTMTAVAAAVLCGLRMIISISRMQGTGEVVKVGPHQGGLTQHVGSAAQTQRRAGIAVDWLVVVIAGGIRVAHEVGDRREAIFVACVAVVVGCARWSGLGGRIEALEL